MPHKTDSYIAMPESIYNEIRKFLGTFPYDQINGMITALNATSKRLEASQVVETHAEG